MYQLTIKRVDNGSAQDAGQLEVDPESLGGKVRPRLIHKACVMAQANRRVGTHKTKTRAEVHATNKKPWRQKGTGRARAGTRRSPLWRGGGTIFGPQPRDYSYQMPKKARRRATQSALLSKVKDGEATLVDALPKAKKTREVVAFLKALGIEDRVLVVCEAHDADLVLATRNLRNVTLRPVTELSAFELIYHKQLVITKAAFEAAVAWLLEKAPLAKAGSLGEKAGQQDEEA